MRCDNCGWNNPEGLSKCQKCNQELSPVIRRDEVVSQNMNYTVMDQGRNRMSGEGDVHQKSVACPKCGYPTGTGISFCPNCGAGLERNDTPHVNVKATVREIPDELFAVPGNATNERKGLNKTVREYSGGMKATVREIPSELITEPNPISLSQQKSSFQLIPMDNFDGLVQTVLDFGGTNVTVGRAEISGKEESVPDNVCAAFEFSDGQWKVQDKSGECAVYVRATRSIGLESGDIVVIGNRRFIFK